MRIVRTMGGVVLTAVLGLGVAANASAQQPATPEARETIEVTEELLERFVVVYPAVVTVAQAAQAQLAAVETAEEAQAIQAEAQQRIEQALEEGDFTFSEYEAVVIRLNQDEELRARFEVMLEEALRDG